MGQEVRMGAARMAGHVLEHQVIPAPQLPQEPVIRLSTQRRTTAEEHPFQQRASIRRNHPLLKNVKLPPLGVAGAVGGTVTKGGLIFATGGGSVLYALDTRDGSVKWQFELPAGRGYANPISYRGANGVQYIVLATGGGDNAELIAFSLDGTH